MRQVLFYIPLESWFGVFMDVPVFGYGSMLFAAFVCCIWLAKRLGRREGIAPEAPVDLAVWLFVFGIIGARLTFMIQFPQRFVPPFSDPLGWLRQFVQLWDGGLVVYGAVPGGIVGYALGYLVSLRKYQFSTWKMVDVIAPCAALGLALGRLGCLLNGCCYGQVACSDCPSIEFPVCAPAMHTMVSRGYQTVAGFTHEQKTRQVVAVASDSPAAEAGLKPGDRIVAINGQAGDLDSFLVKMPRATSGLQFTVERQSDTAPLPEVYPKTLGLHPTQIYETVSMVLLLFFLLSYYPFKRRDGSVLVFFLLGYGVHRFLNEMLRSDNDPVALDLTLSQIGSIVIVVAGLTLGAVVLLRRPSGIEGVKG